MSSDSAATLFLVALVCLPYVWVVAAALVGKTSNGVVERLWDLTVDTVGLLTQPGYVTRGESKAVYSKKREIAEFWRYTEELTQWHAEWEREHPDLIIWPLFNTFCVACSDAGCEECLGADPDERRYVVTTVKELREVERWKSDREKLWRHIEDFKKTADKANESAKNLVEQALILRKLPTYTMTTRTGDKHHNLIGKVHLNAIQVENYTRVIGGNVDYSTDKLREEGVTRPGEKIKPRRKTGSEHVSELADSRWKGTCS